MAEINDSSNRSKNESETRMNKSWVTILTKLTTSIQHKIEQHQNKFGEAKNSFSERNL